MTILFVVIEAGDVALSELAVGTAATPLMLLVALASVRNTRQERNEHTRPSRSWSWLGALGSRCCLSMRVRASCRALEIIPGPYGDMINSLAPYERQVTNAVTAVNFDYRGLDTLGEEFILFAAVSGLVLLLRGKRGESADAPPMPPKDRAIEPRSDAVSLAQLRPHRADQSFRHLHGPARASHARRRISGRRDPRAPHRCWFTSRSVIAPIAERRRKNGSRSPRRSAPAATR